MTLLAANIMDDSSAFYVIMGVGVFMLMYLFIRPKLRRKKDPLDKPYKSRSLAQQRSVERQMETLLVELAEMSRQMTAQLETRSIKLELLIKEADEKIGVLQTLAQRDEPSPVRRFAEPSETRDSDESHNSVEPAASIEAPEPPPKPKAPELPLIDPQHAEIYKRIDQGQSIPEIANAMNRPNGEIQLILALRPAG